ncbi:translesion DNA synthesis-associated protein ImuA [Comamonas sp.]|uniref:translesion DNA synthesis-associated protein ImuA n=1 Tax=Comamonas sp. TaxID=34028 RepID=UPI003A912F7B
MSLPLSASLNPANTAGRSACEEDLARARHQGADALQDIAGVWRGADWHASQRSSTWPTGHAALDAELPGGGWPTCGLTEVLQPAHCHAEWALLLPALAAQAKAADQAQPSGRLATRKIVLVQPPYLPFAPSLQAAGIAPEQLCCVYKPPALPAHELAWACEQALHCRDVLAVLAWLPSLPASSLRRLHWAAASHGRPLWLWQELGVQQQSTPAALRLRLDKAPQTAQENALQIQILKRRGPALELPIQLSLSKWAWAPILQAQASRRAAQSAEAALLMQGRVAQSLDSGVAASLHGAA